MSYLIRQLGSMRMENATHRLLSLAGVAAHLLDGVAVDLVVCELRVVAKAACDPLAAALGAHVAVATVVLAAHGSQRNAGNMDMHYFVLAVFEKHGYF